MIEGREKILTAFTPHLKSETLGLFFDEVEIVVMDELMKSFSRNGHKLTGKLIADMKGRVEAFVGQFVIEFLTKKYGAYLNFGVKAERIPYSRGSGAGTSLYIQGLMKYVRLRMGISGPQQKSIAFAIANVQKQKGMPIRTMGKGTAWIDSTKDDIGRRIDPLFHDLAETYVVQSIREVVMNKETR